MKKVCLIYPRFKYVSGDPPLGISYIASNLRDNNGVDVKILDATFNKSFDYFSRQLDKVKPDIVGISIDTIMYNDAIRLAKLSKGKGAFVVAGGPHATVMPESVAGEFDLVVIGEGEEVFNDIVREYPGGDLKNIPGTAYMDNGRFVLKERKGIIDNLDKIKFPALDLLEMDKYIDAWNYLDSVDIGLKGTTLVASRGCPYKCTYCQPTLDKIFGSRLRMRSPQNVADEITELKDRYGIKSFFFHDDTLTVSRKWITEFCQIIENRKLDILWACNTRANTIDEGMMEMMYRAGLRNFHLGIESGTQRILDDIYKKGVGLKEVRTVVDKANKVGIKLLGFFMLGAPTETVREVGKTVRFASSLKLDEATFSITSPLPETDLYRLVREKGYKVSDDFADYDYYSRRAFEDKLLTYSRLKFLQKTALFCFYLHPFRWRYVLRHFLSVKGVKKIINKIRRFT